MFKNSATKVELKGLRHHRYNVYIAHIQEGNEDIERNGKR
jgi:hypothetical protein